MNRFSLGAKIFLIAMVLSILTIMIAIGTIVYSAW